MKIDIKDAYISTKRLSIQTLLNNLFVNDDELHIPKLFGYIYCPRKVQIKD